MARVPWAGRKAAVAEITICFNQGMQKIISEHTLKQMGYSGKRSHLVPLLSAKKRKLKIQNLKNPTVFIQDSFA